METAGLGVADSTVPALIKLRLISVRKHEARGGPRLARAPLGAGVRAGRPCDPSRVTPPEHDRTPAELMMRSHAGGGGGAKGTAWFPSSNTSRYPSGSGSPRFEGKRLC